MADVVNRTTLQYRRHVNTPDFSPVEWLILNDSATVIAERARIEAIPQRYRKISGDVVSEMTAAEKTVVDDARAAAAESARKARLPTSVGLKSPDGSEWQVSVNDSGAVSTRKI